MKKKRFWQNWRFWFELLLGFIIVILSLLLFAYVDESIKIEKALSKYNYYYDSKLEDIFVTSDSTENEQSTNQSSSSSGVDYGDTLMDSSKFAIFLDQLVLMAEDANAFTYDEADSILIDLEGELAIRNITDQERKNGQAMIDQIQEFYFNADEYDRDISQTEQSLIANNLSEISKLLAKTF
ncbi:TPA: hypothetical protein ACGOTH_000762 [Streptococcus suis]